MFKIEKGIPIEGDMKYPFDKMDVGDSFLVPLSDGLSVVGLRSRMQASCTKRRNSGRKFTVKIVDGREAVRVWRIA